MHFSIYFGFLFFAVSQVGALPTSETTLFRRDTGFPSITTCPDGTSIPSGCTPPGEAFTECQDVNCDTRTLTTCETPAGGVQSCEKSSF
ncbi:hypothetical protein B0H14DRAFT_3432894 [Mycena olivaceomarginata]|nr:hypothetical protein B0H14DRAFT_3432894 [Mycena olivaceomarginata]